MCRSERGSGAFLFVTFLLPFALLLLFFGVDIAQFYGVREQVRQVLDKEARLSLARGGPVQDIESRVKQRVVQTHPMVSVERVSMTRDAQAGNIQVTARYSGFVSDLLARLGASPDNEASGIPFVLSSRVRKATSLALVVLDRGTAGGDPCADEALQRRAAFAGGLVKDLLGAGVSDIRLAVMPGVDNAVDILAFDGEGDTVPRCVDGIAALPSNVGRIQGVPGGGGGDPLSVAYAVMNALFQPCGTQEDPEKCVETQFEQRSLVMITPATLDRTESVTATLALLDAEAHKGIARVRGVGVAVRPISQKDDQDGVYAVKSGDASGRMKYVVVSEDEIQGGAFKGAIAQHLQGRTFVSR